MPELSSSQFPGLYQSFGIDSNDLGCIMLNLGTLKLSTYLDDNYQDDLYYSMYGKFIQGAVAEDKPHTTLLYGLLAHGTLIKEQVDQVLTGWKVPTSIKILDVGVFPGKDDDGTQYSCIIAHLDPTGLQEANDRLRMLPHVDTFSTYRPHFTLAYIKAEATTEWLEALDPIKGKLVQVTGLNYGK